MLQPILEGRSRKYMQLNLLLCDIENTHQSLLSLAGEGVCEDRIETYIFWTYTCNVETTLLLINNLWPTALEGSLDMLIWLISIEQNPYSMLLDRLRRRIKEFFPRQVERLHEQSGSTLTSLKRFFDLLYYQEMTNPSLSGLRQHVAKWMVCHSDELLQRSPLVRSLLRMLPGFKYMFAKAWAEIRPTRLPHRWVDALEGKSIRSIAIATASDDPADFDGFDAWEQSAKRRKLDPSYDEKKPALDPAPTQTKSVRFLESNYPRVDPLTDLMRPRYTSPGP
ncbi:uncharacterized protein A1O9_00792 [Exophiala aquamarina CBS 119918]|uniref:Uncharacterized protein n=1 Tax=Exophiala aquamarina CBS 119918 TaxID=1182545 RepID=A0A072PRX4_9EURO|nr:uncharacterized protein A1O9_00792 [Exophiala aquamarina CBS 119918]KEF62819.1 hypothetical protein A1O9_00792 [Exophiala aquamarina CBS 119918]